MAIIKIPGHGSFKLSNQPAASIARIDAQRKAQKLGPLTITSALRTIAQQLVLIARWIKGGIFNRPPYLFKPKMSPPYPHTTGMVIDTPDINWMLKYGRAHGWRRPFAYDLVHFQYYPSLDTKKPKLPITDTRQVFWEPTKKRWYISGFYQGKSYLDNTRRPGIREHWLTVVGQRKPILASLAEIKAKAGR